MKNTFYLNYLVQNEFNLLFEVIMMKYKNKIDILIKYLKKKSFYDLPFDEDEFISLVYKSLQNSSYFSLKNLEQFPFWYLIKKSITRQMYKLKDYYNTQKQITWNKTDSYDSYDQLVDCLEPICQDFNKTYLLNQLLEYLKTSNQEKTNYLIFLLNLLGYTPKEISLIFKKDIKVIYNSLFYSKKSLQDFATTNKMDS